MFLKFKKYASVLSPIVCLLLLVFCSAASIEGAKTGLSLWANIIVPTLLPFIILTNLMIYGKTLPALANHPLIKKYHPCIFLSIIVGFLCGYPMGGKFVNDLYIGGFIDKQLANLLLVLCNNASPMFIIGYVIHYGLEDSISPIIVFFVLYIPNIILFLCRYVRYAKKQNKAADFHLKTKPLSLAEIIAQSIDSILLIGAYIMLFSILTALVKSYAKGLLLLPVASLEITVGISLLKNISTVSSYRTALILALTAFGGCSSIAQTKSVANAKELSFLSYTLWKLLLAGITGILALYI